jgi:hypothetical protein
LASPARRFTDISGRTGCFATMDKRCSRGNLDKFRRFGLTTPNCEGRRAPSAVVLQFGSLRPQSP